MIENEPVDERKNEVEKKGVKCVEVPLQKVKEMTNVEVLDDETIRMVERVVVLRVSTKHINLWMRQLEMKRGKSASWLT